MFTRQLFRSFAGITAVGTFLTLAGVSQATDNKEYHGTECVQRGTTKPEIRYGITGAVNDAASRKDWVCHTVRDRMGGDITDWDVVVDRLGSNAVWDIQMRSCDRTGETCNWDSVTVPGDPDPIALDGASVANHTTQGSLYLFTEIPAGAQIYSYHVDESGGAE